MAFKRTDQGLINKYLFFRCPVVWVEGSSDIAFYKYVLRSNNCRLEAAGGKGECQKLAAALIRDDHPYVVIMDGDYEMLKRMRSPHRRIVLLQRYSFENYLFEKGPLANVCSNYTAVGSDDDILDRQFMVMLKSIDTTLSKLVELDVAHYLAGTKNQILPSRSARLFNKRDRIIFDKEFIRDRYKSYEKKVDRRHLNEARRLVRKYTRMRRLVDLLRGHIAFGILRQLIIYTIKRRRGRGPNIDNDGLVNLLVPEVWSQNPNPDHKSLRRRLFRAVRDAHAKRNPHN